MKYNFIKVIDESTATALTKLGFQKVDEQNGVYTFLNSDKIQFADNVDKTKIQFSNILCI